MGSLPSNFAQRTSPAQQSPFERGKDAARSTRQHIELCVGAPDIGGHDGAARGIGVGSAGGSSGGMKGLKGVKASADVGGIRGRIVTGRGVIGGGGDGGAAGAGQRGGDEVITAPTALFALPVLEDSGGSGGCGSVGAGTKGICGRKIQ